MWNLGGICLEFLYRFLNNVAHLMSIVALHLLDFSSKTSFLTICYLKYRITRTSVSRMLSLQMNFSSSFLSEQFYTRGGELTLWCRCQPKHRMGYPTTNAFKLYLIITSCISGRGYKNGPVCVCVCVCVSVCQHSPGRTVWCTVTKFGTGIDLDKILDEFDGQGHRSKVKVTGSKAFFPGFSGLS